MGDYRGLGRWGFELCSLGIGMEDSSFHHFGPVRPPSID